MANSQLIAQLNTIALAIKDQLNNTLRVNGIRATGDVDFSGASSFIPKITYAFSAYMTSDYIGVPIGTYFVTRFNATSYNYGGCFNTSTYRFTTPIKGIYHFDITIDHHNSDQAITAIYKNGAIYTRLDWGPRGSTGVDTSGIDMLLDVNDTVEARAYAYDASDLIGGRGFSNFSGHLVGAV